jgi:hypothetical protein
MQTKSFKKEKGCELEMWMVAVGMAQAERWLVDKKLGR